VRNTKVSMAAVINRLRKFSEKFIKTHISFSIASDHKQRTSGNFM
jgi:hypothetical protein